MHTLICIILNFTCGFKCIFKPILNEITGGSYTQPPHGLGYHNSVCFWTMFENCVETCLFCRSKVRSPTVSNRFPLDTFRHSKKNGVARKCLFQKKCGLDKFWPDHVSDRFRPFPTVSDRFRPFHFFWTINWTNSIYGRLIQCKPMRTMTLKFFGATLVCVHCTKYCILTLISNIP